MKDLQEVQNTVMILTTEEPENKEAGFSHGSHHGEPHVTWAMVAYSLVFHLGSCTFTAPFLNL